MRLRRKSRQKYNNKGIDIDGIHFDSTKEGERYRFLKEQEAQGFISDLKRQTPFLLIPTQKKTVEVQLKTKTKTVERVVEHKVEYIADFVYTKPDGTMVVEDVKGTEKMVTRDARLKKKMMLYLLGIEVRYVFNAKESI